MNNDQSEQRVRVLFRKWKEDGHIFALFPDIPQDWEGCYCTSYSQIGQHSGADYDLCIRSSVPAMEEEYDSLKKELESEPYSYNLKIVKKCKPKHYEVAKEYRKNALVS